MAEAYEDGAFYWVRCWGRWTVAEHLGWISPHYWRIVGDHAVKSSAEHDPEEIEEIGPCIGKEPPKGAEWRRPASEWLRTKSRDLGDRHGAHDDRPNIGSDFANEFADELEAADQR